MKKKIIITLILLVVFLIGYNMLYPIKEEVNADEINYITLNNSITTDSSNVSITDKNIYITKGGIYYITGVLIDGSIYIDTKEDTKLILDTVTITNNTDGIISNRAGSNMELSLNGNNILSDGMNSSALIKSSGDLTISGNGLLLGYANSGDGIRCSKNLTIADATIYIVASLNAFNVGDYFLINGGTIIGLGNDLLQVSSENSVQNTFFFNFKDKIKEETNLSILNSSNEVIIAFNTLREFSTLTISSPSLVEDNYYILQNYTYDTKAKYGIYSGGTITGGEKVYISLGNIFTINSKVNYYGNIDIKYTSDIEIEKYS